MRVYRTSVVVATIAAITVTAHVTPAGAAIQIDGDAAFQMEVARCLGLFREKGGVAAEVVRTLSKPRPAHLHRIRSTPVNPLTGMPAIHANQTSIGPGASFSASGAPGPGSGSTVSWNPADAMPFPFPNNELRDPCVSLLHELQHAADADQGTTDHRRYRDADGAFGLTVAEVNAIKTENLCRKAQGLPQRRRNGYQAVPPAAIAE